MLLNAVGLMCALLIGFSAHRAGLCNVRAVSEIITAGSAYMLWSLVQSVLWMAALSGVLVLLSGLPALTAVAAGAYALMLIGIASVLSIKRLARLNASSRGIND